MFYLKPQGSGQEPITKELLHTIPKLLFNLYDSLCNKNINKSQLFHININANVCFKSAL